MSGGSSSLAIEKLRLGHAVEGFDCGKEPLNRFLIRYALPTQQANSAQTYVAVEDGRILGYYSLTVGGVEHAEAPSRIVKGLPRYPVPVMVLARLAIDRNAQGRGLGKGLFKDALLRTAAAADIAGIRALFVAAKDDDAARFYAQFDLDPSPGDPHRLFLVMKDLKRLLGMP